MGALVEDQEDALKAFNGMIKARWATHKKKDRVIRRDWKAVTSKFDGLRAASKADQAEIDAMAGRIKVQKNEIRKLKSLVYKMRWIGSTPGEASGLCGDHTSGALRECVVFFT